MGNTKKGLLLVISGPSGVGKGTVCRRLMDRNDAIRLSVSATTRSKRPGEVEGKHYYFKTREEFERMIQESAFLEYTQVFGMNYYGTPRSFVEQEIALGHTVILEIDVQGAMRVKAAYPEAVLVFIAPPSMGELKSRLIGRGTETPEAVEKRFATAFDELETARHYDYVVVNDILDAAIAQMEAIVAAEKCCCKRNQTLFDELEGGYAK